MKEQLPKLTPKQDAFVKAYIANGGNGTQAAIEAGYKPNSARVVAAENLTKPDIKAYIDAHKRENHKAYTITVEQRLKWLEEVAKAGLGEYYDAQGNTRKENLAAVKGAVEVMNNMLGIDGSQQATPINVTIGVEDARRD